MTPLRQRFIEELVLRGCSERTQEAYVHQVYQLAKHFRQSPDQLSNEQVRAYLLHLVRERKLVPSSINQTVNACRLLYERVLHREVEALRAGDRSRSEGRGAGGLRVRLGLRSQGTHP
jgi:integrase/recombinase XerD